MGEIRDVEFVVFTDMESGLYRQLEPQLLKLQEELTKQELTSSFVALGIDMGTLPSHRLNRIGGKVLCWLLTTKTVSMGCLAFAQTPRLSKPRLPTSLFIKTLAGLVLQRSL